MDKVNYDELKKEKKESNLFLLALDLFSPEVWLGEDKSPKYASDYYLIEGVSGLFVPAMPERRTN